MASARVPSVGDATLLGPPGAAPDASPDVEVVVRLLGPVDVLGAARPFSRAWTLDLVAYLAVHPGGVLADTWSAALWLDRPVADATRHSTVSVARRALGTDRHGRDHLPRGSGRLALGPAVTSDWARFRLLAGVTGVASASAWEAALGLVRGRPFEGLRAPDWAVLEGVQAAIESAVVDVALRLGRRRLEEGDGSTAERAARRALRMCPYDERLYRMVMEAADLQGNPGGVESAMADLSTLVAGDALDLRPTDSARRYVDATPWVHPQTAAMYQELSRHRVAPRHGNGRSTAHSPCLAP
ncbi:MAG: AfsR/SARP family transcriptional regulator [Acidimicrobiales bacterium]